MPSKKNPSPRPEPSFLAGHSALDFLNTRPMMDGKLIDVFGEDADVVRWLKQAGMASQPIRADAEKFSESLVGAARVLREAVRDLVQKRKNGQRIDPAALNEFMAQGPSYSHLVWDKSQTLRMERISQTDTPRQVLAPLAESAAELLVEGNFELIRRCEDAHCVLWFYDQTKSHHRRWCSMATCGNRYKVAAYREKKRLLSPQ